MNELSCSELSEERSKEPHVVSHVEIPAIPFESVHEYEGTGYSMLRQT